MECADVSSLAEGVRRVTRRLVLSINSAWNIANFRSGLIKGLQADGWEVVAMAPRDEYVSRVEALGCRFVEITMDGGGTNPIKDLHLYRRYKKLLTVERPDVFLGYTIKPNVFGSLAAHDLGIPVINNIAGLGTAFIRTNWLTSVARLLYRTALKRSYRVLFQNEDDQHYFTTTGLVKAEQTGRVPGSGIDLQAFPATPMPKVDADHPIRFLMVARLLRDKGVMEYVEAARMLRAMNAPASFELLGFLDTSNPSAISKQQLEAWQLEGAVRYLGSTDDVRPFMARAHCVVLPSYREGVPRTLLEAASMARPLIATDVVGCRDAVNDGVNGFLVRPRDASDLAEKCLHFISLSNDERADLGINSREKVEREFDEKLVISTYRSLLRSIRDDCPTVNVSL